jgi:hypothetical protein
MTILVNILFWFLIISLFWGLLGKPWPKQKGDVDDDNCDLSVFVDNDSEKEN